MRKTAIAPSLSCWESWPATHFSAGCQTSPSHRPCRVVAIRMRHAAVGRAGGFCAKRGKDLDLGGDATVCDPRDRTEDMRIDKP